MRVYQFRHRGFACRAAGSEQDCSWGLKRPPRKGAHIRDGAGLVNQAIAKVCAIWRTGRPCLQRAFQLDSQAMSTTTLPAQVLRWRTHRLFPAVAIAGLGIALLTGAYAFEFVGGFKPCPLCLEQRLPWMFLIVAGGAVAAADRSKMGPRVTIALYGLAALIALYGAYLGLYHAGIEYGWWKGPPECTGVGAPLDPSGGLLGDLSRGEIVMCDKAAWSFAGLSLAGYNFLFSLVAAGLALYGLKTNITEAR